MSLTTTLRPTAIIATRGLLGEYRFDDGSGQTLRDYFGSNDGTLGSTAGTDTNDPTWTTEGLDFDGVDNRVEVPSWGSEVHSVDLVFYTDSVINSASTAGAPLHSDATANHGIIFGSYTSNLTDEIVGIGSAAGQAGWTSSSDSIAVGWHLLQVDFDGTEWSMWIDGAEKTVTGTHGVLDFTTDGAWLGQRNLGDLPFDGQEAYLLPYSRSRTIGELQWNRQALRRILSPRGIDL